MADIVKVIDTHRDIAIEGTQRSKDCRNSKQPTPALCATVWPALATHSVTDRSVIELFTYNHVNALQVCACIMRCDIGPESYMDCTDFIRF